MPALDQLQSPRSDLERLVESRIGLPGMLVWKVSLKLAD